MLGTVNRILGLNRKSNTTDEVQERDRMQERVARGILFPMTGAGEEVYFFKVDESVDGGGAMEKYASLGLEPVGWESLASINDKDHSLAGRRPNGTQWLNARGVWRCIVFVDVGGYYHIKTYAVVSWLPGWWLAGRPIKWTTY
ncbi:MAG: hypothetical protein Q8P21_00160 [bacterium]|nr:hypothetical protein [bacterium]